MILASIHLQKLKSLISRSNQSVDFIELLCTFIILIIFIMLYSYMYCLKNREINTFLQIKPCKKFSLHEVYVHELDCDNSNFHLFFLQKSSSQRLIYLGKLLQDHVVLKEVITVSYFSFLITFYQFLTVLFLTAFVS